MTNSDSVRGTLGVVHHHFIRPDKRRCLPNDRQMAISWSVGGTRLATGGNGTEKPLQW